MKKNNFNKLGISMIALVITMVVLVILTSATVMVGMDVPNQAKLAVFYKNVGTVQNLVSLKIAKNNIKYANENGSNYKWIGVANGYDKTAADNEDDVGFETMLNWTSEDMVQIDSSLIGNTVNEDGESTKYYVGESGTVYYVGYDYEGYTHYNEKAKVEGTGRLLVIDP